MAIPSSLGLDGNRGRLGGHHPAVPVLHGYNLVTIGEMLDLWKDVTCGMCWWAAQDSNLRPAD